MNARNDGGPFHPCNVPIPGAVHANDEPVPMQRHYGASLRDHFAAQELGRLDGGALCVNDIAAAYARIAEHCYRMADAMLKERAK